MNLMPFIYILLVADGMNAGDADEVCVRKLVRGKLVSVGACEENDGSEIMNQIKEKLQRTTTATTIPTTTQPPIKNCEVLYKSKCFTAIVRSATVYDDAKAMCNGIGGSFANIYDVTHYLMLEKYLIKLLGSRSLMYLWTGLINQNTKLHLTTGEEVNFPIEYYYWRQATLSNNPDWTRTHMYINKDTNSNTRGIVAPPPTSEADGAICELQQTSAATTIPASTQPLKKNCEVSYKSKCFTAVVRSGTVYADAKVMCNGVGGSFANIYDVTHYLMLEKYLMKLLGGRWVMYLWTGLTYQNSKLHLTTGEEVNFPIEYHYGRQATLTTNPDWTRTHMYINKDTNSNTRGIAAPPPTSEADGAICEI